MSDCYPCSSWAYSGEDEDYEGFGFCQNPISSSFGYETSECDDGCDRPTSDKISSLDDIENAVVSVKTALRLIDGGDLSAENSFLWLRAFENEDLNKFVSEVRAKCQELDDVQDIYSPGLFLKVNAVIHEWHDRSLEILSLRATQQDLKC